MATVTEMNTTLGNKLCGPLVRRRIRKIDWVGDDNDGHWLVTFADGKTKVIRVGEPDDDDA